MIFDKGFIFCENVVFFWGVLIVGGLVVILFVIGVLVILKVVGVIMFMVLNVVLFFF